MPLRHAAFHYAIYAAAHAYCYYIRMLIRVSYYTLDAAAAAMPPLPPIRISMLMPLMPLATPLPLDALWRSLLLRAASDFFHAICRRR